MNNEIDYYSDSFVLQNYYTFEEATGLGIIITISILGLLTSILMAIGIAKVTIFYCFCLSPFMKILNIFYFFK